MIGIDEDSQTRVAARALGGYVMKHNFTKK